MMKVAHKYLALHQLLLESILGNIIHENTTNWLCGNRGHQSICR
jgi:hypothetical protein